MLRLVKAHDLLSLGNTKADGVLDDVEYDGHGDSDPRDNRSNAEDLDAEEVEAAAVEYAERLGLGAVVVCEQAGKDGAQSAVEQCTPTAPTRIVYLELLVYELDAEYNAKPAQMPMIAEPIGVTISQPAVIATRPASEPFSVMETSGFL